MTYQDIYDKFIIEYDKAGVISSYPSLTIKEITSILDKAYLALIGQKITGNNVRRSTLESDNKSVSDLNKLIRNVRQTELKLLSYSNVQVYSLPEEYMYFVGGELEYLTNLPMDGIKNRRIPVRLVSHEIASGYIASSSNMPWVKNPVVFIEDSKAMVVVDPMFKSGMDKNYFYIKYIKTPISFSTHFNALELITFECSDSMAEELVSLAISFALENVESPRITNKLNMRGLEA